MKVSQLPLDSSPVSADYLVGNQASGPTTQRFKLSDLATFMWTLANIPSGATSPITRDAESQPYFFVASGLVITGDSYGVNRNASMTAGVCYINGRRISIAAVTARTYTASKDTYVDVLDNGDGTGSLVYTEVTNGAAAPALAANSVRIGKVVTGATNIAASSSILQGYMDSLNNLIYPRAVGTKVTDANGWTAYYRGQSIEYHRRITYSQTIGGLVALSGVSASSLPVGMATVGNNFFNYSFSATGNAGVLQIVWEGSTSGASVTFTTATTDGVSRAYVGNIDEVFITP